MNTATTTDSVATDNRNVFELHTSVEKPDSRGEADLRWQDEATPPMSVVEIHAEPNGEQVLIGFDEQTKCPVRVPSEQEAIARFQVVRRRLGDALTMSTLGEGVLVNGLPALKFSVLSPRDLLHITPGVHTYVTERTRPFVGSPSGALLGQKCPFCRIPITAETRVVTCRCGVVYHDENAESHPDLEEKDRLNCLANVRACLSCSRPVTLAETLVWDPATL